MENNDRDSIAFKVVVNEDIPISDYFNFMDTIAAKYDSLVNYPLSEHIIVRSNPWIIDTLKNTEYYLRKQRGEFVYDQKKLIVLKKRKRLNSS